MPLPDSIRLPLLQRVEAVMHSRQPDFVIGSDPARPYLRRWWAIPRNYEFNVYLHEILRSDDDRALHDHPWDNVSILLQGSYREWRPRGDDARVVGGFPVTRHEGDIILRPATAAHRLEITPGARVVTLFITGPAVRDWGFWCPQGFVPWRDFVNADKPGEIGKGCGG